MDELSRAEYPAMLANLGPGTAVATLHERVKKINKLNTEIADWLAERRRVEDQYVQSLRKLAQLRAPGALSDLGVFAAPWQRVVETVESIALSHSQFAERIEKDVESPLRQFQNRKDNANMATISTNLGNVAKDLEDAQDKANKLNRKGGKASSHKVDSAAQRLDSANQQWESQAPFVFESLQAFDESRINVLRDLLTQYQTHESDQAQRTLDNAAVTLNMILEVSTEREIQDFAGRIVAKSGGRVAPRPVARNSSTPAPASATPTQTLSREATDTSIQQQQQPQQQPPPQPPSTAGSQLPAEDATSEHNSVPSEPAKPESKLRRLGTMLGGRRRQSMVGGFSMSPQKSGGGSGGFGRIGSSHGRTGVSPRVSSSNLQENRLTSLAETPDVPPHADSRPATQPEERPASNGVQLEDVGPIQQSATDVNGTSEQAANLMDATPPANEDTQSPSAAGKDAEGFTVPPPMNDPISEAQKEAAGEDADQVFKLNIQNQPVAEEDPEAKEAALSSVVNSLRLGPATRRSGTVRGRRDVRNTIYVPAPAAGGSNEGLGPLAALGRPEGPAPAISALSRPSALSTLASESSFNAVGSDTQSVRSGTSLGSIAHAKHPEMTAAGLNASVIETVSVTFEGGVATSAAIAGEVAFAYNADGDAQDKGQESIRINNFPALEKIGPNRIFVSNTSPEHPDQFTLDTSHLSKTAIAFSYRVFSEEPPAGTPPALAKNAPISLKPAWKPQGDKLGLLLQYQFHPEWTGSSPVTLHNVVFVATYEGNASGAQTKPSGTHLKDKHLVYWRLGDVTLTPDAQKIVCRIVGEGGVEPTPGRVEARWEYVVPQGEAPGSGITFSRLAGSKPKAVVAEDDPFADEGLSQGASDEGTWDSVPVVRKLVSGKYESSG